jgi:beta-glucanase (GH16 family)
MDRRSPIQWSRHGNFARAVARRTAHRHIAILFRLFMVVGLLGTLTAWESSSGTVAASIGTKSIPAAGAGVKPTNRISRQKTKTPTPTSTVAGLPTSTPVPASATGTRVVPSATVTPTVIPPTTTHTPIPATATSTSTPVLTGQPLFDDEFNGSALDSAAWVALNRGGDASNSEQEYYTPSNVTEAGGNLALTINPDTSHSGYSYASGMVQWKSFNFTYGTLEIRAKLPSGAWPALWLLGSNCQATNVISADNVAPCNWDTPGSEEIDMTEVFGSRTSVNQQVHSSVLGNPGCTAAVTDASQNWHTYDLVWGPGSLIWKVDGTTTCSIKNTAVPSKPMFLLMNTAMNPGMPGISGPEQLQVDYVRVSQ